MGASAENLSARFDEQIAANARKHGIPAQSVTVPHNGEQIYQHHTGTLLAGGGAPVDATTVFPAFSVSKLFATVLPFEEVEAGRVDLGAIAARRFVSQKALRQFWQPHTFAIGRIRTAVAGQVRAPGSSSPASTS